MNSFKLQFISPANHSSFDKVLSVLVNGLGGKLVILANHAPYLICVLPGIVLVKLDNEKEKKIVVDNGVLEVAGNNCSIVTNTFRSLF